MKLKVSVFEYLNQKVMYIQDVNYYFGIRDNFDIKLGDYELSEEEVLNIAKENDPEEYEIFINTSIEERINKINTYSIDDIKEQSSYGQFTLCLHPSRKCNLNCKYCFRESEYLGNEQLTFEVAKDAIDFLVDIYAPCASKYVVDLSGSGEPLLQMDLVKQIVDYCKQKRDEICKNIEVMFCTNLTLLTPEIVEYLDNESAIILGTSIDGDQITNDNNRVYANGKGTYNDIVKGLKMFKNKKLGLAVTVTPLNQNVDLIYDYLYHLPNVDCISMNFLRSFDDSEFNIKNFELDYLRVKYELMCQKIYVELKNGNFNYLKCLLNGTDIYGNYILQTLFKNTHNMFKCDAGKNRIVVNKDGEIYACSVMSGIADFYLGNIYTGLKLNLQEKFYISQIKTNQICNACSMAKICGGECYANSYLTRKNIHDPILKFCEIKKDLIKLSMTFNTLLKHSDISSYNKLIDLAMKIQYHYQTDTSFWVVMKYLSLNNIKISYEKISEELTLKDTGITPNKLLTYLKKYININAYNLDRNFSKYDIKFPAISLVNKRKDTRFKYIIVHNIKDNVVLYEDINTLRFHNIPYKEYINKISDIILF